MTEGIFSKIATRKIMMHTLALVLKKEVEERKKKYAWQLTLNVHSGNSVIFLVCLFWILCVNW